MQKLRKRTKTNTPKDAPQVPGNCGLPLNRDQSLGVADLKTSLNSPEVDLPQHTVGLKAIVYALSVHGTPLMPCTNAKARKLLRDQKASCVKLYPFTIKLGFECENQVQDITFGIDSGYQEIGFSAVTVKKEVASGTVRLDDKTSSRLTDRKMYRRLRRNKLWHRKPRFMNRKIKKGWLPPSTQRRYDTHLTLLNRYKRILPITKVIVETAKFDTQKIENSDIEGTGYQEGDMYGYQNMRAYLMAREGGKCQLCKNPFEKGNPSHIHHCKERSEEGSNRPKNLAILHEKCHIKLHKKKLKLPAPKRMRAETFMSIIHKRFLQDIPGVEITYGYITFVNRNQLGLEKTHFNDAFVIAGGTTQERTAPILIRQKHRNNRKLQLNRKGFRPSIRKQRYPIQPKDLVWIDGKKYVASGTGSYGKQISVEGTKKTFSIKKIKKIYHFGSFAFS